MLNNSNTTGHWIGLVVRHMSAPLFATWVFTLLVGTQSVPAQKPSRAEDVALPRDPYVRGDAETLRKAGWISTDMQAWAPKHDVAAVRRCLTPQPVLALETPHFRILSTLAEQRIDRKDKNGLKVLQGELKGLAARLDRVDPRRVRTLDPWLRVHLFAHRLEALHARLVTMLGEGAEDHLPNKTDVLLLERATHLDRYAAQYLGRSSKISVRHVFEDRTPIIATACELGVLSSDRRLAGSIAFNVTHCLFDTYKGNLYELPAWFREGLAHWFAQQADPSEVNRTANSTEDITMLQNEDWSTLVKKIVHNDAMKPLDQFFLETNFDALSFRDHIACWSRIDFMVREHEKALTKFVNDIKGQLDSRGYSLDGDTAKVRFREAFEQAFELDPAGFDEAWRSAITSKKTRKE
ncbi:MAG: hypothetical protein H6834_00670 [Planctomycetes bacterium]|nr:hypothetical protein [Planctomycetota bacterium]